MFLNPPMLAGLGGAVVPLVLHLLARSRYRSVDWGAMMFLSGKTARQSHMARFKQYLLLGIRMALVGLVAMALARPVARGRWGGPAMQQRLTAVIVLDRSYSMAFEEAGRSRFDQAREAALQVIAGLRRGDEVALVLLGDEIEVREPTSNLQMAARDVADLQVSSGAADIQRGLAAARRLFEQPGRENCELYVICDRQAVSWRSAMAGAAELKWISRATPPIRFYVVAVGSEDSDNLAIESIDLSGAAVRNQPAEVEVRVRNYADTPRAGIEMRLQVLTPSDQRRQLKTVYLSVAARSAAGIRVPVTFEQSGSHVISASIAAPGLEADNTLDSAIDVIEPIETLIISGDETGPESRRESFFPRLALTPYATVQKRSGDPVKLTVKGAEEWPSINLGKFQVVILANVPQLTPEAARALEQKVYEGGGLIVAPGSLCRIDNYNRILYRDGLGLLPARLEAPTPPDGSEATSLGALDPAHPVFQFRRAAEALPSAVIGRYFPAAAPTDARVLGSYASGRPFLIERSRGRGRVLLLTTPIDGDWSTLPLYSFYLPFLQSIVRHAATPALPSRNLSPGEALVASFDDGVDEARLDRGEARLALTISAGGTQVRATDTRRPGVYRLGARLRSMGNPWQVVHFVVQSPRAESDLTPIFERDWWRFEGALGFVRLDPNREPLGLAVASDRGGQELWLILLASAMILGVLELWAQRAWSGEAR